MVNICFALNENYLPYMCTLIYSILDNNRDINFKFFVINKDIDINFYDEFLLYLPFNNDIKIIDCKINQNIIKILSKLKFGVSYEKGVPLYDEVSYYRLFVEDFVNEKRILYLDCDILVRDSIKHLWELDLNNKVIGAVPDFTLSTKWKIKDQNEFNSGVMLIDLKKWKNEKVKEKCLNHIINYPETIKFVDQDALNYVLENKWYELDDIYNFQTNTYYWLKKKVNLNPVIVHFSADNKPWKFNYDGNILFKKEFWFYTNKTKFKKIVAFDYTNKKMIIKFFKQFKLFYKKLNRNINNKINDLKIAIAYNIFKSLNKKNPIDDFLEKYLTQIFKIYQNNLNRDPDSVGLFESIKKIHNGSTIEDIEKDIFNSEEYKNLNINNFFENIDFYFKNEKLNFERFDEIRRTITNNINYSSWDKFQFPSIIISIDSQSNRFKDTTKHLKRLGINYHNEISITPKNIRDHIVKENGILYTPPAISKSTLTASFIGHINALKNAYEKYDSEIFFIMEDDVRLFPDPFMIGLEDIIFNFQWDILHIESYLFNNAKEDKHLYSKGIKVRRFIEDIDWGGAAYFIKRDFVRKIIKTIFVKTKDGLKIDLEKTYMYTHAIAADTFLYRFGNTLKTTFPLAQQCLGYDSQIGYNKEVNEFRIKGEITAYKNWVENYSY